VIPRCHRHLTPKYRQLVTDAVASKRVHHLRSRAQIRRFLEAVRNEIPAENARHVSSGQEPPLTGVVRPRR